MPEPQRAAVTLSAPGCGWSVAAQRAAGDGGAGIADRRLAAGKPFGRKDRRAERSDGDEGRALANVAENGAQALENTAAAPETRA